MEGSPQSQELLAMLRSNKTPLDAYQVPKALRGVSLALSRILQTCDKQFGFFTIPR